MIQQRGFFEMRNGRFASIYGFSAGGKRALGQAPWGDPRLVNHTWDSQTGESVTRYRDFDIVRRLP